MQPLIVLSAAFAFLVTYLEWNTDTQLQPEYAVVAEVVRDSRGSAPMGSQVTQHRSASQPKPAATRKPLQLDLSLPQGLDTGLPVPVSEKGFPIDLFQSSQEEGIRYEAELVFDRATGEDITGGKVNIRIPLS